MPVLYVAANMDRCFIPDDFAEMADIVLWNDFPNPDGTVQSRPVYRFTTGSLAALEVYWDARDRAIQKLLFQRFDLKAAGRHDAALEEKIVAEEDRLRRADIKLSWLRDYAVQHFPAEAIAAARGSPPPLASVFPKPAWHGTAPWDAKDAPEPEEPRRGRPKPEPQPQPPAPSLAPAPALQPVAPVTLPVEKELLDWSLTLTAAHLKSLPFRVSVPSLWLNQVQAMARSGVVKDQNVIPQLLAFRQALTTPGDLHERQPANPRVA